MVRVVAKNIEKNGVRYVALVEGHNRHQRRAQYGVPSRSKPYRGPKRKTQLQSFRGRMKYEAIIQRGIQVQNKEIARVRPIHFKSVFAGVKRALLGR